MSGLALRAERFGEGPLNFSVWGQTHNMRWASWLPFWWDDIAARGVIILKILRHNANECHFIYHPDVRMRLFRWKSPGETPRVIPSSPAQSHTPLQARVTSCSHLVYHYSIVKTGAKQSSLNTKLQTQTLQHHESPIFRGSKTAGSHGGFQLLWNNHHLRSPPSPSSTASPPSSVHPCHLPLLNFKLFNLPFNCPMTSIAFNLPPLPVKPTTIFAIPRSTPLNFSSLFN